MGLWPSRRKRKAKESKEDIKKVLKNGIASLEKIHEREYHWIGDAKRNIIMFETLSQLGSMTAGAKLRVRWGEDNKQVTLEYSGGKTTNTSVTLNCNPDKGEIIEIANVTDAEVAVKYLIPYLEKNME